MWIEEAKINVNSFVYLGYCVFGVELKYTVWLLLADQVGFPKGNIWLDHEDALVGDVCLRATEKKVLITKNTVGRFIAMNASGATVRGVL